MPLVILNTNARGGRAGEFEPELRDWLKRHYPGVPLHATRTVGEARAAVAEAPRGSRIALMGGDGTLHHLLGALLDGAHEVAIVALGSGEDGARAMGAHNRPWNRMLARGLRLHSAPSLVDIGWVRTEHEERPFFSSLAAGFDAAVAERALGLPAWLRGTPRYGAATLRELIALAPRRLRLELDGAPFYEGEALFASVLNTPTYGGGMPAVPQARIDDGVLDLLLAGRFSRWQTLRMFPKLLRGKHLGAPRVLTQRFAKMQLEAETPLPLAADGETMEASQRLTVRVGQRALRLMAVPGAHEGRRANSSLTSRTTKRSKVSTE